MKKNGAYSNASYGSSSVGKERASYHNPPVLATDKICDSCRYKVP